MAKYKAKANNLVHRRRIVMSTLDFFEMDLSMVTECKGLLMVLSTKAISSITIFTAKEGWFGQIRESIVETGN